MCPEGTSGARQTFQSCALSSVVAPSASDYVDCPCGSVARIGVVADKVVGVDGGRSFLRELTFDPQNAKSKREPGKRANRLRDE